MEASFYNYSEMFQAWIGHPASEGECVGALASDTYILARRIGVVVQFAGLDPPPSLNPLAQVQEMASVLSGWAQC